MVLLITACSSIIVYAQTVPKLTVGGFWLGQTFEEVEVRGEFLPKSPALPDGQVIVAREGAGHFLNGKCQIAGGLHLKYEGEVLLNQGQSRFEVVTAINGKGWKIDKEWNRQSDVRGFDYRIMRIRVSDEIFVTVSLLASDATKEDPYSLSEVYLRNASVTGPYGDDQMP